MKYLSFVRSSEKYRNVQPPAAMMEAMGKLEYWPEFEGECEVRPIEFQARG